MSRQVSPAQRVLQAWDAGLSKSGHDGQLVLKLQLPPEGACNGFNTRPG